MVDTYHVRSLKRIHDQAAETLNTAEPSSEAIADQFNELLEALKKEYPENGRVQQIESVDGVFASINSPRSIEPSKERLREIKLRTEQLADIFELDRDDFEKVDDVREMRPIVIEQRTDVSQKTEVSQNIEYSQIIGHVDGAMISDHDEEELKELISAFQEEMESDDPDQSRLRELANSAKQVGSGVGVQVGAKLAMLGLQSGYDLIP